MAVEPAHPEGLALHQLIWRVVVTLLLLVGLLALKLALSSSLLEASGPARPGAQSGAPSLVLAFYYTWFDENTWSHDRLPDLPAQTYVSRDRGVMGRHIEQASGAGIDALIVAWYGPGGETNQTEPNLAALLDEAAARSFRIGILFESDSPFLGSPDAATRALQHALSHHANHSAYLRVGDKPVIFFWRPALWSVETWRSIRSQADPHHNAIWIAEGVDTSYLAVFDGHYLYSNTWNPPSDLDYTNQKFARLVSEAGHSFGSPKLWVATAMPGYDDLRTGRSNAFARSREDGAYYERSWQAAIHSQPDWVVITSFNEWPEGTYIEPSLAYGDRYLGLTATWSQRFKAGGGAAVRTAAVAPEPVPTPTPLPEPETPTAFVEASLLNVRDGPGTDYPIMSQIAQNDAVAIVGRHPEWPDWWQVALGSRTGWVFGPLVRAAGPLAEVPVVVRPRLSQATLVQERSWANVEMLKEFRPGIGD